MIQYGAPNSPLKGPWMCDTGTPTPHCWSVCCIYISPHCTLTTMLTWAWRVKLHLRNWLCRCHVCRRNAITNSNSTRYDADNFRHIVTLDLAHHKQRQQNTRGTSGGVTAHILTLWKRNLNDGFYSSLALREMLLPKRNLRYQEP